MNRYNVETADRYDMEPAPEGMWVMHDDVQAAIAAAVAAERERCASAVMAQVEACAEHTYGYTREAAIAFGKEDKFDSHCAQAEEILAIAAMAIKKG